MRTSLLGGLLLVVASPLLVGVSAALGLDLEPFILIGVAMGAVAALVPDRTPGVRLLGFLAGVIVCWFGYVVRAGFLPDSAAGRAIDIAIILALCVGVSLASVDRLPLWTVLLGAGGFAGAFDFTFSAAPTEVLDSSLTAVTSFALTAAVGFLVCSFVAPARPLQDGKTASHLMGAQDPHNIVMEKSE